MSTWLLNLFLSDRRRITFDRDNQASASTSRPQLLLNMLDSAVDTVEEKATVATSLKPAFQPYFEVTTTRECSDAI